MEGCENHRPLCVGIADLNGDGNNDVAAMTDQESRLVWYAGNGAGAFGPLQIIDIQGGDRGRMFRLADMDGDGDADVVALWGGTLRIYQNDGGGAFAINSLSVEVFFYYNFNYSMMVDDVDGDGDLDVVVGEDYAMVLYVNDGTGNLASQWMAGSIPHAQSLQACDVDSDSDADILYTFSGTAYWMENPGGGVLGTTHSITSGVGGGNWQLDHGDRMGTAMKTSFIVPARCGGRRTMVPSFPRCTPSQRTHPAYTYASIPDLDGDGDKDVMRWHLWQR